MVYFGQELLKCDFDNMFTYTLEGEAVMVNGASCYAIYLNKTLDVVNEYFNPYDVDITAANVSIRTPESVYRLFQLVWSSSSTTTTPEIPRRPRNDRTHRPTPAPLRRRPRRIRWRTSIPGSLEPTGEGESPGHKKNCAWKRCFRRGKERKCPI